MNQPGNTYNSPVHVKSTGPWPFVSQHVLVWAAGHRVVLYSRDHRKGLHEAVQGALDCDPRHEEDNAADHAAEGGIGGHQAKARDEAKALGAEKRTPTGDLIAMARA